MGQTEVESFLVVPAIQDVHATEVGKLLRQFISNQVRIELNSIEYTVQAFLLY
ncbi:hypothetical protein Syun_031792 [Stephania yunnanensis]|uniref:Uncharacterized protein n=1 Tax=Stephania yunnanensis TaxID=152371 RepID=A0AAP0E052_9MAGN